uniref:Putative secreted protein n=1 Tax=Anopheles triannulatus TaxID=58253 RepID=A0A2M4B544_9DIPT
MPASLATALASSVLPQPGGPQSNTPEGEVRPSNFNRCGYLTGARIASFSSSRMSPNEPMSFQVTSGTVMKPSRFAEGCTVLSDSRKSSRWMCKPSSSVTGRAFCWFNSRSNILSSVSSLGATTRGTVGVSFVDRSIPAFSC